jgi:uncharacterized membrane protein YkoI
MNRRTKLIIAGAGMAAAAVVAGATGAYAASANGAAEEEPITGPALERATAAALAHLGEGEVTQTEVGDEESYYEVEVQLPDGRQVDVQLDEEFQVVGTDGDDTETNRSD